MRVRGFEFEAQGNVTRELEIIAGYSHLDPRVTKSLARQYRQVFASTALDQASIWGKYTWYDGPLAGFGLGAGVRYVGDSYGDNFNTFVIPSYALFDAAISYDFAYLRPRLEGTERAGQRDQPGQPFLCGQSCLTGLPYCGLGNARTVLGTLKYSLERG